MIVISKKNTSKSLLRNIGQSLLQNESRDSQSTYLWKSTLNTLASAQPASEVAFTPAPFQGGVCAGFLSWPENFQLGFEQAGP